MDNKSYPVLKIAKYLIKKAKEDGDPIRPLKLQKLLYYAQGWHLANFDKPLFREEIEAWKLGPAIPIIYQKFKNYGSQPIDLEVNEEDLLDLDENTKFFLDRLWVIYKGYSGGDLVTATHLEEPWNKAREDLEDGDKSDNEINQEDIREFFKNQIMNNE